mgnify:CR=1 FL=1
MPGVVVGGTGAVALPTPPVAAVYHFKLVPVAVNATAVAFCQYGATAVKVGAAGAAVMLTTIDARGPSQPLVWLT